MALRTANSVFLVHVTADILVVVVFNPFFAMVCYLYHPNCAVPVSLIVSLELHILTAAVITCLTLMHRNSHQSICGFIKAWL